MIRTGQKLVIYKPKGKSARYEKLDQMSFSEKQRFAGRPVSATGSPETGESSRKVYSGTASGGAGSEEFITYTVKRGDTLWEIARKYPGTSETDIARLNNITNSSKIQPGQVIRIKRKG